LDLGSRVETTPVLCSEYPEYKASESASSESLYDARGSMSLIAHPGCRGRSELIHLLQSRPAAHPLLYLSRRIDALQSLSLS